MELKSRILKFLDKKLITKLNSIALDVLIRDNNTKFDLMIAALEEFNISYSELGIGTNRSAVLIDGYVFKIGMDKAGIADNWSEFSLSQELQPFVAKTYECNGLIAVSEYVTVISKEEFNNNKEEVRQILSHLADSYLLGDVGSVTKNFMNWGYRPDGSLVILDYAYIYRVVGDELICDGLLKDETTCGSTLEYDINFHKLICPKCRREYTFHEIRRRISKEYEEKEKDVIKQIAYKLTKPSQEFNQNIITNNENDPKGEIDMSKQYCFNIEDDNVDNKPAQYDESTYEDAIAFMMNAHSSDVNHDIDDTPKELIKDIDIVDDVADTLDNSEPIAIIATDDEDDDCMSAEDIMSILDAKSISDISEENDEVEVENDIVEPDYQIDIPVKDVNPGSIIPVDVADDPFENTDSYDTSETEVIEEFKEDEPVDEKPSETSSVTIVTPNNNATSINVNISGATSNTVKLDLGNDTIVLTSPENVDDMRAMLAADIDKSNESESDDSDMYEDMYDDEPAGFQKFSKKKRDFN